MDRWTVTLTEHEMRIGRWVGRMRAKDALDNDREGGCGSSSKDAETSEVNHIRGARCEYAASIAFNLHWRPWVGNFRGHLDVGGLIEVRSNVEGFMSLPIKPEDIKKGADVPWVLVDRNRMDDGIFRMVGWIYAYEAEAITPLKKGEGKHDDLYFVQSGDLRPNDDLEEWVLHRRLMQLKDRKGANHG